VRPSLKIRVERRLHELGITAAAATRRGRLSRTLIYDILDGRKTNVRSDNAIKLAEALDCDVGYIIGTQEEPRLPPDGGSGGGVNLVRFYGDVAAGIWNESAPYGLYHPDQPSDWDVHPPVPFVPDARFRGLGQFAVRVQGHSINREIPDGYFAVCVPYSQARPSIQDGDLVVVERIRGNLRESTIKRVRRRGHAWLLHPESTDPRYQEPIALASDLGRERDSPDVTVKITGLVIWKCAPVG